MRGVIRAKLAAGESDQQILDDFVASYGDSILTEPPKHGISLGVWVGPVVGVGLGAVLVTLLLKTWRKPRESSDSASTSADSAEPALDTDVIEEYQRFRAELNRSR